MMHSIIVGYILTLPLKLVVCNLSRKNQSCVVVVVVVFVVEIFMFLSFWTQNSIEHQQRSYERHRGLI